MHLRQPWGVLSCAANASSPRRTVLLLKAALGQPLECVVPHAVPILLIPGHVKRWGPKNAGKWHTCMEQDRITTYLSNLLSDLPAVSHSVSEIDS